MKCAVSKWFIAICLLLTLSQLNAGNEFFSVQTLEEVETRYGYFARRRVEFLRALMINLKNASEYEKVTKVNNFFNRMRFTHDEKLWGVKDYWATRMEFIGKDAGDCEDFVIAKYFTLKQLGVSSKKLYFTYVKANKLRENHIVLTYFPKPQTDPLVLDSINQNIFSLNDRKDLVPGNSYNGDDIFLVMQRSKYR